MDHESDSSECWEDFFGSTTDLAPSLLGFYDTLANGEVDDGNSNNNSSSNNTSNNSTYLNSNSSSGSNSSCSANSPVRTTNGAVNRNYNNTYQQPYHHEPTPRALSACSGGSDSSECIATLNVYNNNKNSNSSKSNNETNSNSSNGVGVGVGIGGSGVGGLNKSIRRIRILSPNVQRLITHLDVKPVDTVAASDALRIANERNATNATSPSTPPHRYVKKPTPMVASPYAHKTHKLSNIPLSRNTGKLTQSNGSELVQTFNSSSEHLNHLPPTQQQQQQQHREREREPPHQTPALPSSDSFDGVVGGGSGNGSGESSADADKTPTNCKPTNAFSFERSRQLSIKLIEMEQLATTTQLLSAALSKPTTPGTPSTPKTPNTPTTPTPMNIKASTKKSGGKTPELGVLPKEFIAATVPLSPVELIETVNYPLLAKCATPTLNEAINKALLKNNNNNNNNKNMKPPLPTMETTDTITTVTMGSSAPTTPSTPTTPPPTYARTKSLPTKANTLGGAVPLKLPTAEQLAEMEEASRNSAESLDRLTDIKPKFSPKESRKLAGGVLSDIAKIKHRPLSSSSICSTSSSSSSGSDQLNGSKLLNPYQASAESLADQSENELMDLHAGMSVFQRACMEIVDSERNYVEDLGQVIRGYLMDWKERACLSYEELRVLFSNIEEIFEFNTTLLKQLINSGMDPARIAKCFIDLEERFDVYTTYCTSYPEAISLLTKLLQATHTNALLNSTQKMLQQTLPLGSYLLKPVQRILKYHLLLDNLRKHCDVKEVSQAYEIMRQVARHIDQVKRKLEEQSRVKELSGILDGWLGPELTVLGELRQEGILMEHNKQRRVLLFATMLIITKPKEDGRLQFKSYIHQNNLMLNEHWPGEPTSFFVIPYDEPRNQIKLTAKNRDQKRLWTQHIKSVILEKFENIPKRAKELVYKLGDEEDRTPDKNTRKWSLHSSQSSTPVYLERRNHYRSSEVRNRAKVKRKTVTNVSSFDTFNELNGGRVQRTTTATVDDILLPALQSTTNGGESTPSPAAGACILIDSRGVATRQSVKAPLFASMSKTLKERSKSVPRFSVQAQDSTVADDGVETNDSGVLEHKSLYGSNGSLKQTKPVSPRPPAVPEVKQYNHKMLPKRIATLKKQRKEHAKKETSKFYMDLDDFEVRPLNTELKIVESNDDLAAVKDADATADDDGDVRPIEEALEALEVSEETLATDSPSAAPSETVEMSSASSPPLTLAEKTQRDAQIILDLLKNAKEFERIYKKAPANATTKKKHTHSHSAPHSPEPMSPTLDIAHVRLVVEEEGDAVGVRLAALTTLPPRPPSRSPPPLESEPENGSVARHDVDEEEPIYESLLRNVHVPYKFSPVFGRSKSALCYKPRERKTATPPPPRPESDYVTLVYSPEGALQQVGDVPVAAVAVTRPPSNSSSCSSASSSSSSSSSTCTLKRDSQSTVINMEAVLLAAANSAPAVNGSTATVSDVAAPARPPAKALMKRLLNGGSSSASPVGGAMSNSESSLLPRARKSIDNIALGFGRSSRPPERRVSDVTEMCRQSILHRQGSEAVGERMAHVDYADPRTLLCGLNGASSVAPSTTPNANSVASLQQQRDSVVSLTSSNDSVCDANKRGLVVPHTTAAAVTPTTSFAYEDDVEARLEHDFRDSAIYSDDNDKRLDGDFSPPATPTTPLTPPVDGISSTTITTTTTITAHAATASVTTRTRAPQVPPKPTRSISVQLNQQQQQTMKQRLLPPVPQSPPTPTTPPTTTTNGGLEAAAAPFGNGTGEETAFQRSVSSRSWVLQQISNFNK